MVQGGRGADGALAGISSTSSLSRADHPEGRSRTRAPSKSREGRGLTGPSSCTFKELGLADGAAPVRIRVILYARPVPKLSMV